MKEESLNDRDSATQDPAEEHEFETESDCEDFEDYKWDGYHPVSLGESFNDKRYGVIQKLGWGNFSTVWMVKDKKTSLPEKSDYYAMKIQKSKPSYAEVALDELELLRALEDGKNKPEWDTTLAGYNKIFPETTLKKEHNYCINLLDNFAHYGMHGKHYCIVFPIMGPNLLDLMRFFVDEKEHGVPLKLVKRITRQMLIGMDYMHRIAEIIHTDIKPENIMIELGDGCMDKFINDVSKITMKPLSMQFLKKSQQSANSKNSKKNANKKKKKKAKAEAAKLDAKPETLSQTETDTLPESNLQNRPNHEPNPQTLITPNPTPMSPNGQTDSPPQTPETAKFSSQTEHHTLSDSNLSSNLSSNQKESNLQVDHSNSQSQIKNELDQVPTNYTMQTTNEDFSGSNSDCKNLKIVEDCRGLDMSKKSEPLVLDGTLAESIVVNAEEGVCGYTDKMNTEDFSGYKVGEVKGDG
jgi:hypothetical protein